MSGGFYAGWELLLGIFRMMSIDEIRCKSPAVLTGMSFLRLTPEYLPDLGIPHSAKTEGCDTKASNRTAKHSYSLLLDLVLSIITMMNIINFHDHCPITQ